MPTYSTTTQFMNDYRRLTDQQKLEFRAALNQFIADLQTKPLQFRRSLRVKGIQGASGVYEMSWARDGRCTFQYGPTQQTGEPHIIWRRCGTHAIFKHP